MKEIAPILTGLLLAVALMLGGCANTVQTTVYRLPTDGETYTVNPPQAVLDTPQVAAYRVERQQWAAEGLVSDQPWWATRNDERLNVRPGSNSTQVTDYLVYIHDRQYSSGGHISDSYRRDAYSSSYGRIAR